MLDVLLQHPHPKGVERSGGEFFQLQTGETADTLSHLCRCFIGKREGKD
ncbi:hypothetical protein SDC9_143011 [bioreactor metagenome]|uniref:Uncharacterized protein n=1 Tax=bioreactor metagenome TaxID=1076179 RepID=A0A645E2V0_9ZZZZ